MSSERPTYGSEYNAAAEKQQARICALLAWDDQAYAEYQYQSGVSYLYWYLPCDENARYVLERSKLYWNWFKTQWNGYDYELLALFAMGNLSIDKRREIYADLHCPRALAVEVKPNNVVLADLKKKFHHG